MHIINSLKCAFILPYLFLNDNMSVSYINKEYWGDKQHYLKRVNNVFPIYI